MPLVPPSPGTAGRDALGWAPRARHRASEEQPSGGDTNGVKFWPRSRVPRTDVQACARSLTCPGSHGESSRERRVQVRVAHQLSLL